MISLSIKLPYKSLYIFKHTTTDIHYKSIQLIYMIICETFKVKLARTFHKILYLGKGVNDTFVFVAVVSVGRDGLYHCDK